MQYVVARRIFKLQKSIEENQNRAWLFLRIKQTTSQHQDIAQLEITNLSQSGAWLEKATIRLGVPQGERNLGHALMLETQLGSSSELPVDISGEIRVLAELRDGGKKSIVAWAEVEFWANGAYHTEPTIRYSIDLDHLHVWSVQPARS